MAEAPVATTSEPGFFSLNTLANAGLNTVVALRGAGNTAVKVMTFGAADADQAAAWTRSKITGGNYDALLSKERSLSDWNKEQSATSYAVGEAGGVVLGVAGQALAVSETAAAGLSIAGVKAANTAFVAGSGFMKTGMRWGTNLLGLGSKAQVAGTGITLGANGAVLALAGSSSTSTASVGEEGPNPPVSPAPDITKIAAAQPKQASPAPTKVAEESGSNAPSFDLSKLKDEDLFGLGKWIKDGTLFSLFSDPVVGPMALGMAQGMIGLLKNIADSSLFSGLFEMIGIDPKTAPQIFAQMEKVLNAYADAASTKSTQTQTAANDTASRTLGPSGADPMTAGGTEPAPTSGPVVAHNSNRAGMKATDAARVLETAAPIPVADSKLVTNVRFDASRLTSEQLAAINKLSDVTTAIKLTTEIVALKGQEAALKKADPKADTSQVKYNAEQRAFLNSGKMEEFLTTITPGLKATLTDVGVTAARAEGIWSGKQRDIAQDKTTPITAKELREKLPEGTFNKVADAQIENGPAVAGTPEPKKTTDATPKEQSGRLYAGDLRAQGNDIGEIKGHVTQDEKLGKTLGVPHGPKLLTPQLTG